MEGARQLELFVWLTELKELRRRFQERLPAPTPSALGGLLGMLPERFRWVLHNVVAHPVGEVLDQVGLHRAAELLHDYTIPAHQPGTGRG
jgi:hypothetical protein